MLRLKWKVKLRKKTIVSTLLIAATLVNYSFAKVNNEDSLKQVLVKANDASSKAKILVQLARTTNVFGTEKSIK